jgi:hypothetical protein
MLGLSKQMSHLINGANEVVSCKALGVESLIGDTCSIQPSLHVLLKTTPHDKKRPLVEWHSWIPVLSEAGLPAKLQFLFLER